MTYRTTTLCIVLLAAAAAAQQAPPQAPAPAAGGRAMPRRDIAAEMKSPQPRTVTPGKEPRLPPSDAVILFDGKDMSQWELRDGSPAKCTVESG